jgi:benzoyl-CoA reductase/2-hydroxyglutaryl-CoA dehydratase subunit BcrC/BadD/HgdB
MKNMFSFVEEQLKCKLDWDRMREAIGYSNQALKYIHKLTDLRKNVPSPLAAWDILAYREAIVCLLGTPELADWLRRRYEFASRLLEKGERERRQEEKIRLVWVGNPPNTTPQILDWLEAEYGAVVVAFMWSEYHTVAIDNGGDISKMLEGLASRCMNYPMGRHGRMPVDYFVEEVVKMADDYKADALVFAGHTGCKWNWASALLVKDIVRDRLGIPILSYEFDSIDPRFLPEEGVRAKFSEFFKLVF